MIIQRTDSAGNVQQIINIPIEYAEKEKMMVRMKEDPAIQRQDAVLLPRMSFFLRGMEYDASRHVSAQNKLMLGSPVLNANGNQVTNQANYVYSSVPYKFYFSLYVYVKNNEDATKIIEQIIPFFTPTYTVRAFMLPGKESSDVTFSLVSINHEDTDTTNFADDSKKIWTLDFALVGEVYGPVRTSPLIDFTDSYFYFGTLPYGNGINSAAFGISNVITYAANSGANSANVLHIAYWPTLGNNTTNPSNISVNSAWTALEGISSNSVYTPNTIGLTL